MNITKAVFERGIQLRLECDGWIVPDTFFSAETFLEAQALFRPLRPLFITSQFENGKCLNRLLRFDSTHYFDLAVSGLMNWSISYPKLYPVYHLEYLLSAIGYHCQRIAELYVQIVEKYSQIYKVSGENETANGSLFQNQSEPYFEFDSLLGACMRTYDSLRYILWPEFGKGNLPRSFKSLLNSQNELPEPLHLRLNASWEKFGKTLKDYRDCIHHYVPVDFAMASAVMHKDSKYGWTTFIRIPDNPDVRSKEKFIYSLNRDVLTYSWELADEILDLTTTVVETVLPRQEGLK